MRKIINLASLLNASWLGKTITYSHNKIYFYDVTASGNFSWCSRLGQVTLIILPKWEVELLPMHRNENSQVKFLDFDTIWNFGPDKTFFFEGHLFTQLQLIKFYYGGCCIHCRMQHSLMYDHCLAYSSELQQHAIFQTLPKYSPGQKTDPHIPLRTSSVEVSKK